MQIHKWIKWDDAWTNLQCTRHRNARKKMCDQSQQRDKKWTKKKRTRPAQEMTRAVVLFLIGLPGGHDLANKKPWKRMQTNAVLTQNYAKVISSLTELRNWIPIQRLPTSSLRTRRFCWGCKQEYLRNISNIQVTHEFNFTHKWNNGKDRWRVW